MFVYFLAALLCLRRIEFILILMQVNRTGSGKDFRMGIGEAAAENMFAVHAISDYYILFLYTWLSLFLTVASLLNCDGIITLEDSFGL